MPWVPEPLRVPLRPLHHAWRWVLARWRRYRCLLPLSATVALSDRCYARRPAPQVGDIAPLSWAAGLSVVIPERGGVDLLGRCLSALFDALAQVDEPSEVIIVVNGSPAADYAPLAQQYPSVRWQFHASALGFSRAVQQGVALARFGAIYLLNNDMCLEAPALRVLLPWRRPEVFAIASQILFPDDRRREETGWTFMPMVDGLPAPYHAASTHAVVRGTVWAGAGSALFHAGLLRELLPGCLAYDPFYWEDVDLGTRAWRAGYESLYQPASRALHLHRVTVQRYYPPAEVERVFERNRLQFLLRNPFPRPEIGALLTRLRALDAATLAELGHWRACLDLWQTRRRAYSAPLRDIGYATQPLRAYLAPAQHPVLIVSPFALLPPRHGGALRTHRLASELAIDQSVILLTDEANEYGEPDHPSYAPFAQVHRLGGRPELPAELATDRIARINSHGHAALRLELARLIALYRPRAVLIEHMELAGLVDLPCQPRPPFVLSLHDVLLQPDQPQQAAADAYELALIDRFDALVVSSAEDQALLGARQSTLVPNGCDIPPRAAYRPSSGRNILFLGPFRASINWQGIAAFVREVYPILEAQLPGVSLTVLGGPGAAARVADEATFARPSIRVLDTVDTVHELLDSAALTINPQEQLRGSSLKVLESLAAGRVCVSTRAGARGHREHGFSGLIECAELADFVPVLLNLLGDAAHRIALETPDTAAIAACSWAACATPLRQQFASFRPTGSADPLER